MMHASHELFAHIKISWEIVPYSKDVKKHEQIIKTVTIRFHRANIEFLCPD